MPLWVHLYFYIATAWVIKLTVSHSPIYISLDFSSREQRSYPLSEKEIPFILKGISSGNCDTVMALLFTGWYFHGFHKSSIL